MIDVASEQHQHRAVLHNCNSSSSCDGGPGEAELAAQAGAPQKSLIDRVKKSFGKLAGGSGRGTYAIPDSAAQAALPAART